MEEKKWYQSLTVQGASVVGILTILPDIISEISKVLGTDLSTNPIVMKVLTIAAIIVTIYGRIRATAVIK